MKKHERLLNTGLVRNSDIGKEMTLRNANEHRRLAGRLKDLDAQLHHNLVSMQAEIMELKASPYGDTRNSSVRLGVNQYRPRSNSDFGLRALPPTPRMKSAKSTNNLQEKQTGSLLLQLPPIDVRDTSLVGNPRLSKNSPRENQRKKEFKQFLEPPSCLSSVHRPTSLPDLRNFEESRTSPKITRKNLKNSDSHLEQCSLPPETHPSSLHVKTFDSVMDCDSKIESNIDDNYKEKLIVPAIECHQNIDNNDEVHQSTEDLNDIFVNSLLIKATYSDDNPKNKQDVASKGFVDFNDVIDKRLVLCHERTPSADEMRKVRYLRWRKEEKDIDLVDAVFAKPD